LLVLVLLVLVVVLLLVLVLVTMGHRILILRRCSLLARICARPNQVQKRFTQRSLGFLAFLLATLYHPLQVVYMPIPCEHCCR